MSRKISTKGTLVLQYLDAYPNTPTNTIARFMYKQNKVAFKNKEDARDMLRYYRGKHGKKHFKKLTVKTHTDYQGKFNPFDDLPEALTSFDDWQEYKINGKKTLLICDTHIPYYNRIALKAALEYGKAEKVDTVFLMGDLVDFYAVSFWVTDPTKRDFQDELERVERTLEIIRGQFPDCEIVFQMGNHEDRYERYMRIKAPEIYGCEYTKLSEILHTDDYNIKIIEDKRIVRIGRLRCIHGHEFKGGYSIPVNPARTLYLRGKEMAICGHHHRTSEHNEKTMGDRHIDCWSVGCLCDLRPEYKPLNNWNHGFAVIERLEDEKFLVHNKKIINGNIY
jgi:predicted phosphodiesterase